MPRNFERDVGTGGSEWPGKKREKSENQAQDTQEDAETKFVHTLTPKQKAEYESLDENQKAIVKYVFGVPGVDASKIDLGGNRQTGSPAVSTPPLPARKEITHSGSGRSFGPDTGIGMQDQPKSVGKKKKRFETSSLEETFLSEDRGTDFTHRSGSFASEAFGGGTKIDTNGIVNYLQSLKDEARRKSADPALAGALAAGVRGGRIMSMPERKKEETVWQRTLNTVLGGLKNSAAGITDAARTLYEAGQGGRTRDMQDLRDSAAQGLEMAERQLAYLREHPEAGDAETAQYAVNHFRRQVDAYDKVLNENLQQRATQQTAKLADDLQRSAQMDTDHAKEDLSWFGRGLVDAGASLTQMAGDGILGAALGPGGGLLPFLTRSFGSGTMEARQGGGTLDRQLLNGGLFAGVELLTEKLSSAALPFKAVYGEGNPALERKLDELVTQAVRKFSASPTGQRILGGALSVGRSFVTEGLEEFVGDWLEWQLPRLYGGDVSSFSDQLASSLNSFFTGGLTGLFGAALDPGTYEGKKNVEHREDYNRSNELSSESSGDIIGVRNKPDVSVLSDIAIGRSVGAKASNFDIMDLKTGEHFQLVEGSHLQDVSVFAGKSVATPYRNAAEFARVYGGEPENWQHVKGVGSVDFYGESRKAELHWSQCEGVGKFEFFIKEWLE